MQAIQVVLVVFATLMVAAGIWGAIVAIRRYATERDRKKFEPVERIAGLLVGLIAIHGETESRRIAWRTDDHEAELSRNVEVAKAAEILTDAIMNSEMRAREATTALRESADRLVECADRIAKFDPLFQGMVKIAEDQVAAIMKLTAAVKEFSKVVTAPTPTTGTGDFLPGSEADGARAQSSYDRQIREALENPVGSEAW